MILANGAEENDPTVAMEFRQGDGLPNFFQKIKRGETVRIAYLGGSMTVANGWRPKTEEAAENRTVALHNFTDFECLRFRKNAAFTGILERGALR